MGFLDDDFNPDELFKKGPWKVGDIEQAKKWLGIVLRQFDKAKANTEEYEQVFATTKDDLIIPKAGAELSKADKSLQQLKAWTNSVIKRRQQKLSLGKKTQWAVYQKNKLEDIITKVSSLTTKLIELFPMMEPRQQELCREEVQTLPSESMRQLLEAIKGKDKMLSLSVADEAENERHYYLDVVFGCRIWMSYLDVVFDGEELARLRNVHE